MPHATAPAKAAAPDPRRSPRPALEGSLIDWRELALMTINTPARVLKDPGLPTYVAEAAHGDAVAQELTLALLASHEAATPELLRQLLSSRHTSVTLAVVKHPNTPPELLEVAFELAPAKRTLAARRHPFTRANRGSVREPTVEEVRHAILDRLSLDRALGLVERLHATYLLPHLAKREDITFLDALDLLTALPEEREREGNVALLHRPDAETAFLQAFAQLPGHQYAKAVATAPAATPRVLSELHQAHPKRAELRPLLAAHPRASEDLLHALHQRGGHQVMLALAGNPNAPTDMLVELSRHDNGQVRERVAQHQYTPAQVHAALLTDPDPSVRLAAAAAATMRWSEPPADQALRAGYALNPYNSPEQALAATRTITEARLLARLAIDPRTPAGAHQHLLDHPDPTVRASALLNPHAYPHRLLTALPTARDPMRRQLLEHPNLPLTALAREALEGRGARARVSALAAFRGRLFAM